jgi:UDP-2,3-diacylglucosamine pyrophosphatase LpxH
MVTLIASDIHCGDSKSGHEDFIKFLDLQPDVVRLVIAGDLCDFWVANLKTVISECSDLFKYIHLRFKDQLYLLPGNHDEDLRDLKSVFPRVRDRVIFFIGDKKKVVVLHGHQIDPNDYIRTRKAKVIAWLINKFDKWAHVDTRKMLVGLADQIHNDPYDKLLEQYEKNIITNFEGKFDYVVTGHTHHACLKDLGHGVVYCNTGDFMQHRTALRFHNNKIELVEYKDKTVKRIDTIFLYGDNLKDTLLEKMT